MNAVGKEIAASLRTSQRLLYCRCERALASVAIFFLKFILLPYLQLS